MKLYPENLRKTRTINEEILKIKQHILSCEMKSKNKTGLIYKVRIFTVYLRHRHKFVIIIKFSKIINGNLA